MFRTRAGAIHDYIKDKIAFPGFDDFKKSMASSQVDAVDWVDVSKLAVNNSRPLGETLTKDKIQSVLI